MGKVEEVARAICEASGQLWRTGTYSASTGPNFEEEQHDADQLNNLWRFKARAAIEAMREPTEVMLGAMNETTIEAWDGYAFWPAKDDCKSLFNAAIDAALSEDKE